MLKSVVLFAVAAFALVGASVEVNVAGDSILTDEATGINFDVTRGGLWCAGVGVRVKLSVVKVLSSA